MDTSFTINDLWVYLAGVFIFGVLFGVLPWTVQRVARLLRRHN